MVELAPEVLAERLGWRFGRPELLVEALTHSTYANEHEGAGPDNERLEFVGDAVLGLLTSRLLYESVAGGEGELSRRRAQVVQRGALAAMARELELHRHLRLGVGQSRSGEQSDRTLAGAYEAVVGAVYMDAGFAAVERCFGARFADALASATHVDFKTALQELCHTRGKAAPAYAVVEVSGPDHARRYHCEVRVGDEVLGRGEASTKKGAEQACAERALCTLEER